MLTIDQRASIVKWMLNATEANRNEHNPRKAVAKFSSLFRGSENANLAKASRMWKCRDKYIDGQGKISLKVTHSVITRRVSGVHVLVNMKVKRGRSLKRPQ